ncbi:ribosylglycohydrolase [Enemella evansiae]|uniref:ADP-ribosylglycohydrolase family protein n=1 Tax=Enemella evansiae TaxID=2016499 RepID=UPI000B97B4D6|nr:ADP-ribosylglycohydrolase family protein [Enemella evansiae]OYO07523.1 ribosylglycohydrolase [Enemella evansiae]
MQLDEAQLDRAIGALTGAACGDALGAGYEFETVELDGRPEMIGGGLGDFAPGEWTDDTAQTFAIARVAATGRDLRDTTALNAIARGFAAWYAGDPPDVGVHTSNVLGAAGHHPTAATMRAVSDSIAARGQRTGGNGTLMRTAPVALAHLDDPAALIEAAGLIARLTHHDPVGAQACALWCLAIRHAILTGELPALIDLVDQLPRTSQDFWRTAIEQAESLPSQHFNPNGYVVTALQAAWSAITSSDGLVPGLEAAIAIGNDTDTVACIAGALLGARWGHSAIPDQWREIVHGWENARLDDLAELAVRTVRTVRGGAAG